MDRQHIVHPVGLHRMASSAFAPGGPEVADVWRRCADGDLSALDELRNCDSLPDGQEVFETIRTETITTMRQILGASQGIPVRDLADPFGTLRFGYNAAADIDDLQVAEDGLATVDDQQTEWARRTVAVPVISGGFSIGRRQQAAQMRDTGEPIDLFQIRSLAKAHAYLTEDIRLGKKGYNFGDAKLQGYLNWDLSLDGTSVKNTVTSSTNFEALDTDAKKQRMLDTICDAIDVLGEDLFPPPYDLLVRRQFVNKSMSKDWKAGTDGTIGARLREVEGLGNIIPCERMTAGKMIIRSRSATAQEILGGVPPQWITYEDPTGWVRHWYLFSIESFLLYADFDGRSGYVEITYAT